MVYQVSEVEGGPPLEATYLDVGRAVPMCAHCSWRGPEDGGSGGSMAARKTLHPEAVGDDRDDLIPDCSQLLFQATRIS